MNERLKTHSKTQKKSADLVSNKLRIGVFQRYQMKCKSVSKKSPRYTTEKNSAVYGMLTSLTITAGQKTEETEAAEKFVTFMEQADNIADWVMMSPGAALPVNKAVVTTATWKDNDVIKALGELPNQLIGELPNIQVFGAVGDKNFTRMGDVTGSGVVSSMVHNVTVGKADLPGTLQASQKKLDELIEQH